MRPKSHVDSFVEKIGPLLYKELLRTNTNNIETAYRNMISQLAWESDYGRSHNARTNKNYGGVGWNGKTYFHYDTDEDFVTDYVRLMNKRYGKAVASNTVEEYAKALKDKGYYEDTLEHYTWGLKGMSSLRRSADAHRKSNPDSYTHNKPKTSKFVRSLEENPAPKYNPPKVSVSNISYDPYYTTPMPPKSISRHNSPDSPSYRIQIPSVLNRLESFLRDTEPLTKPVI